MHPELIQAVEALGLANDIPTLKHNAELTESRVREGREFLRKGLDPKDVALDVVALGSMGREESSAQSDFDWLIIAHGLPQQVTHSRCLMDLVEDLETKFGLKHSGRTNVFGRVVSSPDLTEFIGLEDDTNRSLTHRILTLGESVSLYQPEQHELLVKRIFERYLVDYKRPKDGVPRFLLNDVLRYWRTLAVDYQAKRWEGRTDWGLRYIKLLISRKLAFTGFVIPLLLCTQTEVEYFVRQFKMPPLGRIAQLHTHGSEFHDPLRTVIKVAEEFMKALSDAEFRTQAEKIVAPGDKESWPERFKYMKAQADKLQDALQNIFFESKLLGSKSKKYLSF
jgi:predicted nucleotidyltransferase